MKCNIVKDENKKSLKEIKEADVKKMTLSELRDLVLILIKVIKK